MIDPPAAVDGRAPALGRLEPALRWLAGCQGAWPPQPPAAPAEVRAEDLDDGAARADDLADRGCDLLVLTSDGDQAGGLVVAAVLADLEPVRAVGTSSRDFARLTVAVREGLRTGRGLRADPAGLLGQVGGPVAAAAALLQQAAARRTPVLLDGSPVVTAAALAGGRLTPGASAWWLAGAAATSPAAEAALRDARLTPLVDLGVEGPAGARLARTLLLEAVAVLDA